MNPLFRLFFVLLICPALTLAQTTPSDVCSPRLSASLTPDKLIAALREPIDEAIATLDSAQISFPSPSLASGKINYVTISPNFADDIKNICVIGYFEHSADHSTAPLLVDHLEVVKMPNPHEPNATINTTRIYFRTPFHHEFMHTRATPSFFKFWERHQSVQLKLAAFSYKDGQRGASYFGHDLQINISSRDSSIFLALLFALICYLIAAGAIPRGHQRDAQSVSSPRLRIKAYFKKLSPWYISGASGKASLSQLQMLVFTLIVATLLFYQWVRTGVLQEISTDLLYLIGISTAGAGGSQITDSVKKNLDPKVYDYVQQLGWFTAPMAGSHGTATLGDLLLTSKKFDIYKFQMMMFTLVIAAYVIACGANELATIQISSTLLTLMGMSQGAYMGGKAGTDTLGPLQDQLRGMQSMQQQYQTCNDTALQKVLKARYALAAQQAADMFGSAFGRDIPQHMQTMQNFVPSSGVTEPNHAAPNDSTAPDANTPAN